MTTNMASPGASKPSPHARRSRAWRWLALLGALGGASAASAVSGCSGSGEATNVGGGGSGTGGDPFGVGGAAGAGGWEACVQVEADATLENRPVDVIFVIDNSNSMSEAIEEVESQINQNFATIIDSADPPIDYRVIMVSRFGSHLENDICIAKPLGGIDDNDMDGHCDSIPSQPVNTAKFYHHARDGDPAEPNSGDHACALLEEYDDADFFNLQPAGYQEVLRDDSFKFFVVVTDNRVSCSAELGGNSHLYNDEDDPAAATTMAADWDAHLLSLSAAHFGTTAKRNYSFWSIIGLAPYNSTGAGDPGDPHPPDPMVAPLVTDECTPGAVNSGTGYQAMSLLTGGYRFPHCGLDYTEIFQLMAQGVIEGGQIKCEFDLPEPPAGEDLDLDTVEVQYSSDGTLVSTFDQVDSSADCTSTSFYVENDQLVLCPDACSSVRADEDAALKVLYGCELVGPN